MTRLHHVDDLLAVLARYGRVRERLAVTKLRTPEGIVETAAFSCLFTLAERPMRSGELAEHLFADPSTVSRHIASLVRLGYVRREADPQDGRATILVLTDSGRTQVEAVRSHRTKSVDEMLADFSTEEIAELARLMGRVVVAAEEMAAKVHDEQSADCVPARGAGIGSDPATVAPTVNERGTDERGTSPPTTSEQVRPEQFPSERREKASR